MGPLLTAFMSARKPRSKDNQRRKVLSLASTKRWLARSM